MNFRTAVCAGTIVDPFAKRDAEIVECDTVRIDALAVWTADGDELWRKVKDLPKFLLTFAQCLLGLHAFFSVEVDADPIEHRTVVGSKRFCAGYERIGILPERLLLGNSLRSRTLFSQAVRPDSARLIMIIRMQKLDMGVPGRARVDPKPKRMVIWQTAVVRCPFVDKSESARWGSVPGVCRNCVEGFPQLFRKRCIARGSV